METYEQMIAKRKEINAYWDAKNNCGLAIIRMVETANNNLDAKINDLRHSFNDQLIDLKYGKGYKANFLDEILLHINNL